MNEYSHLIKRIREELLLSQVDLAEKMGVSFATINRWEKGHHEPTFKSKRMIRDFCKKNNIDVD
jgi:Predicted transcriptional regulator